MMTKTKQYDEIINETIKDFFFSRKNRETNLTLYHGSITGEIIDNILINNIRKFFDNQFFTVSDYIAYSYALNLGGLVYTVNIKSLTPLELRGNYVGMDTREPKVYKFWRNLISELYGETILKKWERYGFQPSPPYIINGEWSPLIEWAEKNGYDSLKFIDESFDGFVKDTTYMVFDGAKAKIIDAAEPEDFLSNR